MPSMQGAAVAAFICQLQHLVGQSRNAPTTVVDGTRSWAEMQELFSHPQFRFAWLCSGELYGGLSAPSLSLPCVALLNPKSRHGEKAG